MPQDVTIRVLDALTIDQMAAGEVVERPASVVKELAENAIDAGAQNVEVVLQDGGKKSIAVVDDGSGMSQDNAERAILRHATSKLREAKDLEALTTLGFRGEALSSIAAVSRFTLTTRPKTQDVGFRLMVEGGVVRQAGPVGCAVGTQILVEELFFNVPARRKFMRAKATEQAMVHEVLLKVALCTPGLGLVLRAGARRLLDVPKGGDSVARARLALGVSLGTTATIDQETSGVAVTGMLAAQPVSHGEGKRVWLFVNGRFVRDRSLQRAAVAACAEIFAPLAPTALVYLRVPPEEVDINVHPQKLEVRFCRATAVHEAVSCALRQAALAWQRAEVERRAESDLSKGAEQPERNGPRIAHSFTGQRSFLGASGPSWRGADPSRQRSAPPSVQFAAAGDANLAATSQQPAGRSLLLPDVVQVEQRSLWEELVPLGVAPKGFMCCRHRDTLVLVDLKAGERACILQHMQSEPDAWQQSTLMMPPTWCPDAALQAAADDYLIETAQKPSPWGLTLEAVGPETFVVTTVPKALEHHAPAAVAEALLHSLDASSVGCHEGFERCREQLARRWLQQLLHDFRAPAQGSAAVWGPTFLRRLQNAAVPVNQEVVRLIDGAAIGALKAPTWPTEAVSQAL